MNLLFRSKAGRLALLAFVGLMAFAVQRVLARRHARAQEGRSTTPAVTTVTSTTTRTNAPARDEAARPVAAPAQPGNARLAENAAYLDRYYELAKRTREDRDRQGNPLTRRESAGTPSSAGRTTVLETPAAPPARPTRATLRLQGQRTASPTAQNNPDPVGSSPPVSHEMTATEPSAPASDGRTAVTPAAADSRPRPTRFNPYGRVLKCELVFTIDSTNEQTPLIGVVMEPVYNNGALVIPAGAELHGVARPDRLRDRIFSGQDWVLVFPRAPRRPNGRQLNVRGVALDRVEPDANGMTWGLTDGSYGLSGKVIRTLDGQEIKRFVATFLAASAVALQDRQSDRLGQDTVKNTPQNAALQGVAANLQQMAEDVTAEIAEHGVFIRVPAGHQFYFYPMQIIDPDAAEISQDIATAK